jgi:hypothetical protein
MGTRADDITWAELKAMIFGLAEQSKDTDRKMQETERLMKEASQETERLMKEASQETDRKMQETDRQLKETGRYIKEMSRKIEGIGDKFGYFTEGMALPSMERILAKLFKTQVVAPRFKVRRDGREQEYDVLASNDNTVVIVEIKSRVRREAIAQLESQLEGLPQMLPDTGAKQRMGILAGVDWDPGVRQEAQAAGLYTASIHDEIFTLTTPEGFEAKRW